MPSLSEIELSTKQYADARGDLGRLVRRLNDVIERVKRKNLPGIKAAVARAKERYDTLKTKIEESPELFAKPRTVIFHGIKVGLTKGKGEIEWDDDNQVLKLIHKHLPELADVLIKTTEKPIKKAISGLTVDQLKSIGCSVEETGDIVVIKSADSEVEKIVNALLKDQEEAA